MAAKIVLRNLRNAVVVCALVLASASGSHGQASLRGSIGPSGYTPPSGVQITWRDQSNTRPPQVYTLNKSIPYDGSDLSYAGRYGGGTSWTVLAGLQPAGVGSGEWQGGRSYLILRELYRQKGIDRDPCPGFADKRCQEVIDFAAVEFSRPPGPKEFVAMTGQPDPICGSSCLDGGTGQSPLEAPTDVKLSAAGVLSWAWTGLPTVANLNFIVYVREGTVTTVAGTARGQKGVASQTFSVQLNPIPPPTAAVSLWARASKRAPSEIIVRLPGIEPPPPPVDPPPPPPPVDPPPVLCKLADVLPSTTLDALWIALSSAQREQLIVRALETLLKERKELP